jgi:cell division protein FtsA
VGTTKVCAVVGRVDLADALAITGVGLVASRGMERGIVVDRQLAIECIREAVRKAQGDGELRIASVYVGVTGAHISSVNVRGRAYVTGSQVTQADVEQAVASAQDSVPLTTDRRIIHSVVRDFALDGERGIRRPLGMVGRQLDVNLHVVTGRGSIVDNVLRCVEEAGVQPREQVLEPQATAAAVLTDAEQRLGCVLVDIGGGTTDLGVFADGSICHTSALAVAGNHVTMDIAKVLRVAPEEAERVKCEHGHAIAAEVPEEEEVEVTLVGTEEREWVPRRLIAEIIQARMEEIFAGVAERLTSERLWALAPAGVVISGGGSSLPGAARLATMALRGLATRLGSPRGLAGEISLVQGPPYATGVGLARIAAADGAWCTKRGGVVAQRTAATWSALARVREKALEAWHRFRAQRQ